MGWRRFWRFLGQSSSCKMGHSSLHGEEVAAPLHGRACAGICAIFALIAACAKQESWAPVHAGVTVIRVKWHSYLRHNCCRVCTCARICVVCSFTLGTEGGGVQLVQGTCRLAWRVVSDRRRGTGIVLYFLYFWHGWECRCVYVCVYAHTHRHSDTHCTCGSRCEPRGWDETPQLGGPEESRWTQSQHSCMCTKYTCVHICWKVGWDLDYVLLSLLYFVFRTNSAKDLNVISRTRIEIESRLHRPQKRAKMAEMWIQSWMGPTWIRWCSVCDNRDAVATVSWDTNNVHSLRSQFGC